MLSRFVLIFSLSMLAACASETNTQQAASGPTDCNTGSNSTFGPPPGTPFGPPTTGLTVESPSRITDNSGTDPAIATAVVGDQVYVYIAWVGFGPGGYQILFKRSTDGGATFDPVIPLSGTESLSPIKPLLAASDKHVYLVWAVQSSNGTSSSGNSQIRFAFSDNLVAEKSFSIRVNPLSDPLRHSVTPSIAASGDAVYVTWVDSGTGKNQPSDQLLRRSLNGGTNFDPSVNISNTGSVAETPAALAVDGNRLYVAWEEFGSSDPDSEKVSDIFIVWSDNGGESLSPWKNLSDNLSNSKNPAIAATGNHVYVVWDDFSDVNIPVLRLRHSEDRGENFGLHFDFPTIGPQPPHIAAEGDNVFITWEDRDAQTCNLQVFASISKDAGVSLGVPVDISQNPVSARSPSIAAAEGQGYLLWQGQFGSGDAARDVIYFDRLNP